MPVGQKVIKVCEFRGLWSRVLFLICEYVRGGRVFVLSCLCCLTFEAFRKEVFLIILFEKLVFTLDV